VLTLHFAKRNVRIIGLSEETKMFTPSPEQGFNPNLMGDGLPPDPFLQTQHISVTEVGWEDRMFIEEQMSDLVQLRILSESSASWLVHEALGSPEKAQGLINRINRPSGFNGPGSIIGGNNVS
jgi:hypothetical protein